MQRETIYNVCMYMYKNIIFKLQRDLINLLGKDEPAGFQ
jgi:hypothetical protein